MLDIGMILMTVAILQFTVIPPIADLNSSHAANPEWPGHARFHVVTQVLTTTGLGLAALYLLWSDRLPFPLAVCFATLLACIALGGFFISVLASRSYGAVVNPRVGLAGVRLGAIDGNVANFGISALLLVAGRLLVALS